MCAQSDASSPLVDASIFYRAVTSILSQQLLHINDEFKVVFVARSKLLGRKNYLALIHSRRRFISTFTELQDQRTLTNGSVVK